MMDSELPPPAAVSNWARTRSCRPARYFEPRSEAEVQAVLREAGRLGRTVSVFGSGHSPSDIAMSDADGWLMSLDRFASIIDVDVDTCVVRLQGGTRLFTLNEELGNVGLAMPSLGSVSEQSLAGALATGTHGTGAAFGLLSNGVLALRLVTGAGEVLCCSRSENADVFSAALCGLGCVGVVTEVEYQACKAFRLRAEERPSSLSQTLAQLPQLKAGSDHFRFVWFPHVADGEGDVRLVDMHRTQDAPSPQQPSWFWDTAVGFHALETALYLARPLPLLNRSINRLYARLLNGGASQRTDTSHKVFNINCLFKQYVNEWAIPAEAAPAALEELKQWVEANAHVHFPVEVRFCRGDDAWLSPCHGRDSCYIGVIMYRPFGASIPYKRYFAAYEAIMERHGGRPHWAKAFECPTSYLRAQYPRFDDFVELAHRLDPQGVLWRDWHTRVLGPRPVRQLRSRL